MQRDRLFRSATAVCAPLLLWALHFFGAYVFVAASCTTALADAVWIGHAAIWLMLVAWTVAALLLAIWLLWVAWREGRYGRDGHDDRATRHRLLPGARIGCAALGLIGIAWTALPLLALSACTG